MNKIWVAISLIEQCYQTVIIIALDLDLMH